MSKKAKEIREVLRITLLGNYEVGKTTLRNAFLNNDYSENTLSTVGINKVDTKFNLDNGKEIKLIIWDTAGQERFHSIAISSVKNSQGIILVFDITNRKSFEDLNMWIDDINNATDKASIILFGNKCDLQNRKISKEEAEKFAKKNNIPYIETSAKLKLNINEAFSIVVNDAYKKYGLVNGLRLKKKKKNKGEGCC
jgi:small GTP-binding protein